MKIKYIYILSMQTVFSLVGFWLWGFLKDAYVYIFKKGTFSGEFWKLKLLGLDLSSGILSCVVNNFTYIY